MDRKPKRQGYLLAILRNINMNDNVFLPCCCQIISESRVAIKI